MTQPAGEDLDERLAAFAASVELESIVTYEVRGRRRDGDFTDLAEQAPEDIEDREWTARVWLNDSDENFGVRLLVAIENHEMEVASDQAVIFTYTESVDYDEEIGREFASNVALMTLWPYVRQSIHDTSSRLGSPITLSLLRQGGLLTPYEGD